MISVEVKNVKGGISQQVKDLCTVKKTDDGFLLTCHSVPTLNTVCGLVNGEFTISGKSKDELAIYYYERGSYTASTCNLEKFCPPTIKLLRGISKMA
jgi:hypothetical protein